MRLKTKNICKLQARSFSHKIFLYIINIVLSVITVTSPVSFAYAQDGTDGVTGAPYHTYLPITSKPGHKYYVSPHGNDANSGKINNPWRTLGKAAEMVSPGSIVYLRDGVYNEYVSFRQSGTAAEPIKILAYPGENPIIDGQYGDPGIHVSLFDIRGDYYYVSGIEIKNSALMGMYVYGSHNTVDKIFSHHNKENGILVNHGQHSTVENCRVWRNALSNEYGARDNWATGLSAARDGVSDVIIRNNHVWENWGEGISSFEANNVVIENNISHDNYAINIYISDTTNAVAQRNFLYTDPTSYTFGWGPHVGIAMGDERYNPISSNIVIINNLAYGNQGNYWWWQGPQGGGMNNVLIANNTFVNGIGDPAQGRGNVVISNGTHQNVRFENNIVQQDDDLPVIATFLLPGITYSHNLWSKTPIPAASGTGDIIADPQLAHFGDQYSAEWYMLSSTSPAINHALTLSEVTSDYFGTARVPALDIGANEFFQNP